MAGKKGQKCDLSKRAKLKRKVNIQLELTLFEIVDSMAFSENITVSKMLNKLIKKAVGYNG